MLEANIGLNDDNLKEILSQVQIIINCAASVDFNARLDDSLLINVKGTRNMFDLAC
jgi:thioester reductase-like protein